MADPHGSSQGLDDLLGEDLMDEAHPLAVVEDAVGGGGHPRRLLATVLKRPETPEEQRGGTPSLQGDTDDSAKLADRHGCRGSLPPPEPTRPAT